VCQYPYDWLSIVSAQWRIRAYGRQFRTIEMRRGVIGRLWVGDVGGVINMLVRGKEVRIIR